ncbi:MAG: hypothetical protein ACRC3Z_08040 [Phocaeicola sp.]
MNILKKLALLLLLVVQWVGSFAQNEVEKNVFTTQSGKNYKIIEVVDTIYRIKYDTVYVYLTPPSTIDSTELIKVPAVGRFDRGILNYRFLPKGKWLFGATASYLSYSSQDITALSVIANLDANAKTYGFNPFVGYVFKDNQFIGAKLGYEHLLADLGNLSIDIDEDLDFSLTNFYYSENLYTMALVHRSYVGIDTSKRFGFFSETTLSYKTGYSTLIRGEGEERKHTETKINEVRLQMSPGIAVYIMQNISAEISLGIVGLKYRSERQKSGEEVVGTHRTSGADFKINLLNINFGITVCL